MKKMKAISILLVSMLVICSCGASDSQPETETEESTVTTVRVINSKAEVSSQMEDLATAFNNSQDSIVVEIETIQSGVDIQSTIKGYYLADNMPDIISCESSGFEKWEGLLVDLSDQAWVSDTDAAYTDSTYGVLGFPFATEAIGFAYNADILSKAGIDPTSLTSPSAYKEAFEILDSKKDELGLTAVVGYCAEDQVLYWSTGNHIFGTYIDAGLDRSDTTYFDLIEQGELDDTRITAFSEFIGMLNQYSDPALLTTGTYDDQVLGFASGKYAFVTQGSWIGSTITASEEYQNAGSFSIGMAPYAFQDGIDTIQTNAPSWWAVVKEGNTEAAKEFLNFCYSDAGQQILVEEAGFVSPFKSCKYVASDPFAQVVTDYVADSKTSSWHWMGLKEGIAQNNIAPCFKAYAEGTYDSAGFVSALKKAIAEAYSEQ